MDDPQKRLAVQIVERMNEMRSNRANLDIIYQDIKKKAHPNAEDFLNINTDGLVSYNNQKLHKDEILDDTPCHALTTFGNGMHSLITSPFERWFELDSANMKLEADHPLMIHYEDAADRIFRIFKDPIVQFNSCMQEFYLDQGAFGTTIIHPKKMKNGLRSYRLLPLARTWIDENDDGVVDVCYRMYFYTTRQAIQALGDRCPEKIKKEKSQTRKWTFIHAVYPREDGVENAIFFNQKKFASVEVCMDTKEIVSESGFDEFPFLVCRWRKRSNEVYGYSPIMDCLLSINNLNEMTKIIMISSQLRAAPIIVTTSEDVVDNFTAEPFAVNYMPAGETIASLKLEGDIKLAFEHVMMQRETIKKVLFNDMFESPNFGARDRVTRQEVVDNQSARMLGLTSAIGRIETELFNPLLNHEYESLIKNGFIQAPITADKAENRKISYISPAAMAQRRQKAANTSSFLQAVIPLVQFSPALLDTLNLQNVIMEAAKAHGVSRRNIRTQEEIAEIQQSREEEQQMQQMQQAAPAMSSAIKDIAQAQKASPSLMQDML